MNLEIFKHVDDVIELYESKRDIYKLISEEIQAFFETNVFTESSYSLNFIYRLKSSESIREKLLRNNYISNYREENAILSQFQDLIGLRIECKFIDDEAGVYALLTKVFSETDDQIYYYCPILPKIKLKLSVPQPQKQKNGFDIYKIDGIFMLGKEPVLFELQIMALVNSFWGEIEHRIIYKNNTYHIADTLVSDLMTSIKKSLSMIDGQLYALYNHFRNYDEQDFQEYNTITIERFISKVVYDTFSSLMLDQIGFTIDFKSSCDAVITYIMHKNNASDIEDYGRVMLNTFYILNGIQERNIRVDQQIEFSRAFSFPDEFSNNIAQTVCSVININYKWHIFFLVLFHLEWNDNNDNLESFIRYYKLQLEANRSFALIETLPDFLEMREDLLSSISVVFSQKKDIVFLSKEGLKKIHQALNAEIPLIIEHYQSGMNWSLIKNHHLNSLKERLS